MTLGMYLRVLAVMLNIEKRIINKMKKKEGGREGGYRVIQKVAS